MKCPQHYLTEMQEVILFYNGLDIPTRQILDSKGVVPTKTAEDAKKAIQEMAEYSQKWHNGTSRGRSTETSDGLAAIQAQLNNLGREIKKVNEKVYAAQVGSEQCKGPYYTKDFPLKEEGKTLEEAYYTCAIKEQGSINQNFRNTNWANEQEQKIHVQVRINDNPILRRLSDYYYEEKMGSYGPQFSKAHSYKASHIDNSIPQKEKDQGELATVKYPKGIAENVLVGIDKFVFLRDFIILDMTEDVKVPLILGRPFLSTAHAKIDVFKRKITLRVGDEKIIFKSVKPASSLIKRAYMIILREIMELDLEARLMGETLVLNRSLNPLYGDYIELDDLNVPLELKRDQVDDLMPTIEEGEWWKIWMATEIKTWEIFFLENHSAKLHVWKQKGLMD
ncbi:putative reverse transcriptase domain-containing protein [Tanacetum coccineum]